MAAINLNNASVTSEGDNPTDNVSTSGIGVVDNYTYPTPNPDTSVSIPVIKDAEDSASVDKPSAKNAQSAATLNVPLVFTGQDFADIDAPSVKTALPDSGINAPVAVNDQSQPDITSPSLISDEAQLNIANPSLVNDQDSVAISTPSAKTSITQPSIANPSLVNDEAQPNIANPVLVSDQDSASISAPSAITSSVTDLVAPPFPLNHARILYENELFNYSSVVPSSGGTASYAINPNTWQRWTFTATGSDSILITLPSNVDVDTICIGAHNLLGVEIAPFYDADSSGSFTGFTTPKTPSTNDSVMFHVSSSLSVRRLVLNINGATGEKFIGYISAGVSLQMQRPFFSGHTPITDATVTKFYDSWTESGNIIGRSKRSQGQETNADFKNIDDGWYRNYFQGFEKSALTLPYFFAWNLLEYPDDVGLCFTDTDISAPYSGVRNLRSISFPMKGAL